MDDANVASQQGPQGGLLGDGGASPPQVAVVATPSRRRADSPAPRESVRDRRDLRRSDRKWPADTLRPPKAKAGISSQRVCVLLGIAFCLGALLPKVSLQQTTKVVAQTCSAAVAELRSRKTAGVEEQIEEPEPEQQAETSCCESFTLSDLSSDVEPTVEEVAYVEPNTEEVPSQDDTETDNETVISLQDPHLRANVANTVVGMMYELGIAHSFNLTISLSKMHRLDVRDLNIEQILQDLKQAGDFAVESAMKEQEFSMLLASNEFQQIPLEVDLSRTCSGAHQVSRLRQAALDFAASGVFGNSGLAYAQEWTRVRSRHPAAVVEQTVDELKLGDCFAFKGNCTITLLSQKPVRYVAIEQVDRWRTPDPRTSPRHFSVLSEMGDKLEEFEYKLAGPARQFFQVPSSKGFRLEFGKGWLPDITCLYRIQAFS